MTAKTLITSILSIGFMLVALGCANESSLVDSTQVNSEQDILKSVAQESRESLESVLRNTRLEVLKDHRKIILSSKINKTELRLKLKKERQLIHTTHNQILAEYDIKSKKRISDILLSGL